MPTLKEREDGCHCVVGRAHNSFSTWQIDREGVMFLRARNVNSGDRFSIDLFFELENRGLIYTAGTQDSMRKRRLHWHDTKRSAVKVNFVKGDQAPLSLCISRPRRN